MALLKAMVEQGRGGKSSGAGFYEYDKGRRKGLWPGLAGLAKGKPSETGVDYLARRMLYVQAVQAVQILDSGILRNTKDGEVGAVFGIGFAPAYGGPFGFLDRQDLRAVVRELDEWAKQFGSRYAVPERLRRMAETREKFFAA